MPLSIALSRLQTNGYMVVHRPPQAKDDGCSGADKHTLVYGGDPTYTLTITPDRRCKVVEITRRLRRGMEL